MISIILFDNNLNANPTSNPAWIVFISIMSQPYQKLCQREENKKLSEVIYFTIFHSGSILIATSMNSLSKKGTRASRPQAEVDLFALKQSYKWRALIWSKIQLAIRHTTSLKSNTHSKRLQYLSTCFLMKLLLVRSLVKI